MYANYNGVVYISTAGQAYGPLGGGIQSTTQPQWTATNSGYSTTFNNAISRSDPGPECRAR